MPTKEEDADRLAQHHYNIVPGITRIFRLIHERHEDESSEPIKLLEVSEETLPLGIRPVSFSAQPPWTSYPSSILEITPEEFDGLLDGDPRLRLPDGWKLGDPIARENAPQATESHNAPREEPATRPTRRDSNGTASLPPSDFGAKLPLPTKEEVALDLAQAHFNLDPEITRIFRLIDDQHEDEAEEPVKLLMVNVDSHPYGVWPLYFRANERFKLPISLIVITPEEYDRLIAGDQGLKLPTGWRFAYPIERAKVSGEPSMTPRGQKWARGYAKQAQSDFEVFQELTAIEGVPFCQRLHFLQMACEKLCKAYLCAQGTDPDDLQRSHVKIAGPLPVILEQQFAVLGGKSERKHSRSLKQIKQLAREIELLAPAAQDGGKRHCSKDTGFSFPRSAWECPPRRSAAQPSSCGDAERRRRRSHAERGNEIVRGMPTRVETFHPASLLQSLEKGRITANIPGKMPECFMFPSIMTSLISTCSKSVPVPGFCF